MLYHATVAGRTVQVDLEGDTPLIDGRPVLAELRTLGAPGRHSLIVDGHSRTVDARRDEDGHWVVELQGHTLRLEVLDERSRAIRELTGVRSGRTGPSKLKAPMPGLIVQVEVGEGDVVQAGQGLVVIEAMKMENELRADGPARVARVLVEPGQAVERNALLIEFEPLDQETEAEG